MELPLPEALITYGHVLDGANRSLSDLNEFRLQGMQSERIGFGATKSMPSNWLCCSAEGPFSPLSPQKEGDVLGRRSISDIQHKPT